MVTKRDALSYQISSLPNSYIPKLADFRSTYEVQEEVNKIVSFNEPKVNVKVPKLSQWDYLDHEKVEILLTLKDSKQMFQFIDSSIKNGATGRPKDIFTQLLCDTTKFCQNQQYDVEKSGTVLSQFYLTHTYLTSGVEVGAEKLYLYFKDLTMCHSLPFPPSKKKVFTLREAKDILDFFCKVYLRNLPLLKYLCLPNFALYLNYEIPPLPLANLKQKSEKKGKGKKETKRKKK